MSPIVRVIGVIGLMAAFAMWGNAAEVVSMKLCSDKDYDATKRECADGKGLEGTAIVVPPDGKAMNVLTAIKTDKAEEIYHVWVYGGKISGANVSVYDSTTKTRRKAEQSDLEWLKERKIEGAWMMVKLSVMPSSRYRTRSQKTLDLKAAGPWKVLVYDSSNVTPIGEIGFTVTPPDQGVTED